MAGKPRPGLFLYAMERAGATTPLVVGVRLDTDLEGARARYEQALAIDPRLVDARHGLANLLRQLGRLDEAAAQFRQVVALRPDYAEAFSNLGVVLAAQGPWADAAEQYQRAIAIKPELVDVYRNLARALGAAGRADEALAAIMRGLAMGETDEAKAVFVQCAQSVTTVPPGEAFRDLVAASPDARARSLESIMEKIGQVGHEEGQQEARFLIQRSGCEL